MPSEILYPESIRPVELDWYSCDQGDSIVVTPRDLKRFEIQTDKAIQILQVANEETMFQKQLSLLMTNLGAWVREHREKIREAYLTLQDGALAFVVVKNEALYDCDFDDSLTDLDFTIANDPVFNLIKLHALALPPVSEESLQSFLDRRFALSYHGT